MQMLRRCLRTRSAFAALLLVCALPFLWCLMQVWLLAQGESTALGADPGKAVVLFNGEWALRFLLITLCISPLRQLSGMPEWLRFRRMLGLYACFYALVHLLAYQAFLLEFRWTELGADLAKRPYVTLGALALLLLLPLAVTSTNAMMARLGKRWKVLHRLVYASALLAVLHLIWLTRSDYTEALVYAVVLALVLGYRLVHERFASRFAGSVKKSQQYPRKELRGAETQV